MHRAMGCASRATSRRCRSCATWSALRRRAASRSAGSNMRSTSATTASTTTTSTRCPTSSPMRRVSWASTHSRGSSTFCKRRPADALRILVAGIRRMAEEAKQDGVEFDTHDARYARTDDWLTVVDGLWSQPRFSFAGKYYRVENAILEPKQVRRPRPTLYAGGESPAAKSLIARACDG